MNKRNWLGKEQLRYFELYSSGQIKYYESKKNEMRIRLPAEREYRDSAYIDENTIIQFAKNQIKFASAKKNRQDYVLVAINSKDIK